MKSPFGRRGAICAHFGWSWEYLHNGIAWTVVQRIMIDAPSYEFDEEEGKGPEEVVLREDNETQFINAINDMI